MVQEEEEKKEEIDSFRTSYNSENNLGYNLEVKANRSN
jgi:hypothetical protein